MKIYVYKYILDRFNVLRMALTKALSRNKKNSLPWRELRKTTAEFHDYFIMPVWRS